VIRELVGISSALQGVTSGCAGTIKPTTSPNFSSLLSLEKFETKGFSDPRTHIAATPQTTLEFLLDTITRWEQHEKGSDSDGFVLPQWSQLRKLCTHLHTRGFIPDEDVFYFCHLDLLGRNILVSPTSSSLAVTGILD
jgi:hypothetical protein